METNVFRLRGVDVRRTVEEPYRSCKTRGNHRAEQGLDCQVRRAGNSHFLFASDFPHEIGPEDIMHEIEEVQECPGLTDEDKAAILGGNARRFYQMPR